MTNGTEMFRCSGITSRRRRGEQAAGTAGLSCGSLLTGIAQCPWHRRWFGGRECNSCANTAVALNQVLPGGVIKQRQQSSAVQGVEPPCVMLLLLPAGAKCGSRGGRTDAPLGLLKQRKESPVCPGRLVTRGSCCQALWELLRGVGYNPSLSEQHSCCCCNSIHIYLYIHICICICISII